MSVSSIFLVSMTQITFFILGVIVLGGLGLSAWLVFKMIRDDYKYRKFKLPIDDEYVIDSDKEEEVVNPLEITKFNISSDGGDDDFIKDSRKSADKMHRAEVARREELRRINLKKAKKEIQKNKKKENN